MKNKLSYCVATLSFFILSFVLLSGCTSDTSNNNSNNPSWMNNYTSVHLTGTGSDNLWINFPADSAYSGQRPQHLTWITEDLKEKPVVFVCHRTGCAACTPQADRVKTLREIYGADAIFYDLDYPFEGYGVATEDILNKFYEAFYYDPNGGSQIIAFTGVFTNINENGEVKIGWHSWEGNVADAEMETWIKDSIYYYNMNSEK